MVRETNNVCFGQIAQETQVVVREDNKRDHLKRSTEDVSPPNFTERNSGYYERSSRLVADTDSYIRRSSNNNNNNTTSINNYQSSGNSSNNNSSSNNNNNSTNNNSTSNPDNRSRTRDRLYINGPYAVGVSSTTSTTPPSATTVLSERTSSGAVSKINNSRVPPASWYEAAATYTNGPGGSGNADVSAANFNHYQTAASTEIQTATAATTNSTTTSSYTAYSYVSSSPAHNNTTTASATTPSSSRNTTIYGIVSSAGGVQQQQLSTEKDSETNISTTPPLLNRSKQKLLKSSSSRSGSASPTSTTTLPGTSTMTSSSAANASTSSSASATSNNNNNSSNQTANNSCSSISSTINSNTNNSLSGNNSSLTTLALTTTDNTQSGSNVSGILNAAALAAAASKGSSTDGHKNSSSSSVPNSSSNASATVNSSSNNPSSISASHHTSRSAAHFHGRSTTSSSRSHSRSPSSYSSSHSSSSSSSSTASSHSHASSPVGGRDIEPSSSANISSSRVGSRSLQSAVAVPGTSSALNPSGSNVCGSSSSSTSSTSSGTPIGNPVVHSEDNRPLAIRVRNLPARSSDTSLKDGLFHEYKKHGKVTWVKVVGQNAERYALVCFKKPEDVEKALEVSHDKLFFGCKIEVEPYQGYDVEDNEFRPYEAELDEYHPKSTRTLFIGNLEKEITASELRQHFECFGEIIEIDIKKQGMSAYAFCQYSDIVSVVKAMRKMDGEHLGNNRIKLGFGKSMPTNCVWIDGIGEKISESHLQSQFSRYGAVSKVVVDRQKQLALVLYEQIQYAQTAVKEMRGATLRSRKLQVDFASRECQDAFYEKLEKQSAGSRFNRYESQSRSRASSFSRHQNSNDGCSPSNTPGSSSSSSAGVPSSAPTLSSAIVAGASSSISASNTTGGSTLASVVGQASGNTTPARSRGSRSSRHTMDYDYLDTRRFRSYDEYSQGSAASQDEDGSASNHPSSNTNSYSHIGLRSDSPLLSRLGPIVNSSGKESSNEMLEMALSRRRCDKSPAKQKGDIRLFQKERAVLLEQLEECPSSGDESIVSPRKRIKIDHHSNISTSGLSQSHLLDEQQPQHKNSNCDYLLNDPMHRKSEVRRLSESSSLNKYPPPPQPNHHSHHAVPPPHQPHHHNQQQQQQPLSRRPSIDFMATTAGGAGNLSARHSSTSSSNSDHHPPPHQTSSLACKRRRVIGSGSSALSSTTLIAGSSGSGSNLPGFGTDDFHHHASRGRGHQLHSHHSHEASGGESADGSRPGTPLCDERPEVLPSEPRRVPRERPREPMVLPLPKFGIQFFQQYRNSVSGGNTPSYHHHHHGSSSFTSSSPAVGSTNSGGSHLLSNSLLNRGDSGVISSNSHSSLSHSSATTTSATATGSSSSGCYLPSPSTRYPPHWRPNNHHHHHHHHQQHGGHHGPSGGATPSSSSSMVSPMRSRSLSSNSSDSDVPGQSTTGSPSLEERIRTLDEMYERWSGGGSNSSSTAVGPNVVKRHDFNNTPPTWQHHRSTSQTDLHHHAPSNIDVRSNTPSTPASRHKFLDIDVNEMKPSDIVKSLLAKKSIFDDDLQRLKKNHWYEPTSDASQLTKNIMGVCTSPGLPNLQATKTPVVGCTTSLQNSVSSNLTTKPSGVLLQRLSSLSPMNSPQASMSPYSSPSPSPSVTLSSAPALTATTTTTIAKSIPTIVCGTTIGPQTPTTPSASTSPASAGGTKCLQYPFPTHPPLPNTAAPVQSAQPIPPPPAESSKPMAQPPLPPMEVHQPPQPPATSPTPPVSAVATSSKPKTSALSKSLSVPPPPVPTAATGSRILTKSVSVPGSTNVGTVKSSTTSTSTTSPAVGITSPAPLLEQKQPQQTTATTGSSSSNANKSTQEDDTLTAKPPSHTSSSSTTEAAVKRSEKSHKHNHRSSEDKRVSKNDRRKNSNSSQSQVSQASTCESSDADEHDSKKERKERQERREKELRKQQEREEREREEREREEKERLEKEKLEKERLEKERLERERLEQEERERVQREKERLRKEEEQRAKEERERKEKEEKERKLKEQREREESEKRKREESERQEREEQLRKENEQKEKEKLERQRLREEKERERKIQEETTTDRDFNLLKEHQRKKETAAIQFQTKTGSDMAPTATTQTAQDFFRHGESERQTNKENSTEESSSAMDTATPSSGKHKTRKSSRNTSPIRHPKRRLSSQDSNASNSANSTSGSHVHTDDHAKRMRIDIQTAANATQTPQMNNHNSVNNVINERRDSKEHHHVKERNNKHNRLTSSTTTGHKSNLLNSHDKEHNSKHHRNKHHHKQHATIQSAETTAAVSKSETETTSIANCINKTEDDNQSDNDLEIKSKTTQLLSSDDDEVHENANASTVKTPSGNHKHREHGSGGGHHSRHKSSKREREHHREKKRHSTSAGPPIANTTETVPSTPPPAANCNATDEEIITTSGNELIQRRTSAQSNTSSEIITKVKREHSSERKLSRSEDGGVAQQPQTPSSTTHRHSNFNKSTPQSSSRRMLLSSAEDTDGGGAGGCVDGMGGDDDDDSDNRQHSIFDIPDDGPYVSMYDKVKARSCKNMQKQEEEKKIKAKFSQLKQSRAKREEKKRSTSYDGDSDSDFEGAGSSELQKQNRSGGSYKMLSGGGLSSTDEDNDADAGAKTPNRDRRRSSHASSSANSTHPNRVCSDSDDNSITQERLKLQDNIRRLCDDGDETSDDDLTRRHNTGLSKKRLLHHTSRIASDSESQSASDIKLKQEPIEASNDGSSTPVLKHLKQKLKKEVDAMEFSGETSDFGEFKFKRLNSLCSSADEQATGTQNIKSESTGDLLSANEIKQEIKDFYATDDYLQSDQKFHKSPAASVSQHCSPEQAKIKKHKKSKKRQKTPTQDSVTKDQMAAEANIKHSPTTNLSAHSLLALTADPKSAKLLTSPCYDAFDELKRGDTLIAQNNPDVQIAGEKKRHKERKEKKREKLRHMSADVGSGVELDKTVHEKEKHRLKKSKKSKSVDIMRQIPAPTTIVNAQLTTTVASPSCTPQHKRSGGEKMEDIFGPISDEDDEDLTDSDIGGRDLNCITNRNTSSSNMTGPIVSAALNPYKQEPLTPKSHTQEENEENKQKLTCSTIIGGSAHLERVVERQHRKEKREKKRKEREKSRGSEHNQSMGVFMSSTAVSSTKPLEDENSVDLDAAGRALEAQLMEDSDNKLLDEATPSTATTHRSDMTDVFRFSDGDENSLEMTSSSNKHEKKDVEKEHTTATATGKNKEKKKKKKRSKEEKQLHHQRRESSSSNASQQMVAPSTTTTSKLTIDVQSATKHAQKITEEQQLSSTSESPLCKPSPSLPCLIGDDDDDDISSMQGPTVSTPNTSLTNTSATAAVCTTPRSSKDLLNLSPHMRDKQMISPIPKTPTISNTSGLNSTENINKLPTTPSTPTSSTVGAAVDNDIITTANTTPTSSISVAVNNLNKSNDSSSSSNAMAASSPTSSTASVHTTTQKKKSEIFIPGFDGEIDERISESAVQSISAEFNTPLDSMADEPKIPVESPPDSSKIEKLEESKSRVTISQEETESAVSALLGESFGNSSADYSFNDDDDDLNNVISEPEPVMVSGEPDEEAALAAKAIECEVASSAIADSVEDTEEVCKAVQCLRQEELDIKADTPQSVRDLQIDTDTEENADEADSSGSHSLKIDETAQSNNSSGASDKVNTTNPIAEDEQQTETSTRETAQQQKSSVITKLETPVLTPSTNTVAEPKIEPPTITKQDQPAVQPVQAVMPTVNEDSTITLATTKTTTSTSPTAVATTITTTTPTGVTMSYTSTPIKTPSFTFAPTSTCSSTPKQSQISISNKSITSSIGYVMQPPTITIPDTPAHFVVPQLMLSPKGIITTHHNDSSTSASSTSSSMHSPSGHHMPPQSPVGAAYMMGVRAQSPHSPRQHTTSRGNTPTPRQASPHTVTHTPPPTQQNIIVQRDVQQHQNLMSPPSYQPAHTGTQNNSPLSSPNMPPQRQQISGPATAGQGVGAQMQHSPNTPEQHMIKINNYSTPPSQNASLVNIRIPPGNQHQQQLSSPQQSHNRVTLIDGHQPPILGQHYAQNSSVLNIRMPTNQTQPQQQMQSHGPLAHGPIRLISPEQHPILGPYYAQNISIPNIRIPASQRKKLLQAHNNKLQSPHSQKAHPLYTQHNLPISVQKMPPVPTHPTIISKVVTVTPQQAQQSTIQSPGGSGQQQSPKASLYSPTNTSGGGGGHLSRSTPQILQQVDKPITTQTQQQQAAAQMQQQTTSQMQNMQQRQQQQPPQMQYMQQTQQQQHIMQLQQQQMMHQDQQQKLQQQNQHAYTGSQQQRLASPQQMQQQQQQTQMHLQQQQLKVQYQQHHMAQQMMQQSPVQQSPTPQQQQQQEQNVIQNISQTPQRFLVQQHIVGMPSQQQSQQQEHSSPTMQQQQQNSPHAQQQQSPNTQQKPSPIYSKQQHLQHLRQQSPSPQRVQQQQQQESKHNATETSRVLVSTTPTTNATEVATKTNIEKHSTTHSPIAPQQLAEAGVSVIRTPTPTRATVTPPIATPTNKESPSITPAANINMAAATRSAPLTEENVIKISPPKHDEMEQDSKEDSDYWSAKELNVVEQNNTSTNSVSSTVIKKNETLTSSTTTTKVEPNPTSSVETKAPVDIKTDTKVNNSGLVAKIEPSTPTTSSSDSQSNASNIGSSVTYSSQSVNVVTTDHDTEDETETQQMPTFEQVPIQGRPSTRGTGAKRGRQPRGGKKAAAAAAAVANVMVNANVNVPPIQTELGPGAGVQTRLRKPNAVTPATRGRKGRPPRNLLMQQQQLQQQEQPMPTPSQSKVPTSASTIVNPLANTTTPVLTSAEKKARNQATANEAASASVSESNQQQVQQNQDVYEFHEESGDESKAKKVTSTLETVNTVNPENRPRLILTIKSPAQGHTPLVKALEKPANVETKPIPPPATPVVVAAIETTQQETVGQTQQTELTAAELAAAAATRKSRRLLEKDRSTIDDIIEDVVRNTNTNAAGAGGNVQTPQSGNVPTTNVLTSTLPKGAQTPPRRSGRNSSQPRTSKGSEVSQTPANPIGRPRKSKDRKNTNDLMDIEQTPSPQAKQVVHDISDVEDTKSVTTPTPPPVQTTTSSITESVTSQTAVVPSTTGPNTNNSIPQHPKKKALAAAEIESYQISTTTPNIHSALPAGGVPMLNTAAPASQKTTGGVADSVNKPIIDPVTGTVSGIQMQQAKEGNLPSATAASQPIRGPIDPKKMMQAAVAAAAVENSSTLSPKILQNPTLQGSAAATPITALTKPIQVEATAAQAAATSVATAMLNKSVSVVVKTSTHPQTLPAPSTKVMIQQQQQEMQISHAQQQPQKATSQQMGDVAAIPIKQSIIMQQPQTPLLMHAQQTNVRPPTSLKAHVLNSQKFQQQQQQHQSGQQQYGAQQQSHQQPSNQSGAHQPSHVIQTSLIQRQTTPQQQLPQTPKQLLVNIPPPTVHSPHNAAAANAMNSPRNITQHTQQQQQSQSMQQQQQQPHQSLVIKQGHDLHSAQVLHVVSSKTSAAATTTNKSVQQPTTVHHVPPTTSQQQSSYTSYIQQTPTTAHSTLPHQPIVIHQQTIIGAPPSKTSTTTTPLVMPPGMLGLPPHPAMVIQTKTSAPARSPSASSSVTNAAHLQHPSQHTQSPPLQSQQHLIKQSNNPMIHSLQSQNVSHILNAVPSPSPPSTVKPPSQQSSLASNVAASSLRTAIPTISPQSQARMGSILLPGGMQVPHFEASMSEASFPGGPIRGVPTREHLMIYQQLLRQHDPLNPATLREYDEKLLGSSPPLELRRPGSVPRTVAVPHSLQSPQDRATDSPQVAQVYVHNTRLPAHTHYDVAGRGAAGAPSAYYDATRQMTLEPPPAHRSASAHSVVAPPTVVVPHPSAGSSSPFMPAAPPASGVQTAGPSGPPPPVHHSKILEREREQREREQQLMREKEQVMVRTGDAHNMQVATPPPHQQPSASHQMPPHAQAPPPPQADSLLTLLQRYPVMWQGLLALKTDQAAVQMHFVFGNPHVARASLPCNSDGSTPPLRIAQRMRLEQTQLEGVAKKMQFENEHCMLLALPCGHDHADVLQQSRNLQSGFITYLQQKMAAGIVNIPMPGSEQAAYVVHIFPSCDFANENLEKAAPDLKNRVADIAHLLIVIATV